MLTELPLSLPGRVFGCPMPFGSYDRNGATLLDFQREGVSIVVLLCSDEECLRKTGRNIREVYDSEGLQVIHFPIRDYGVPEPDDLRRVVKEVVDQATTGHNIAIHCSAGIGRTGLTAACLARQVVGPPGWPAIEWVRRFITGAVETTEQEQLVMGYEE